MRNVQPLIEKCPIKIAFNISTNTYVGNDYVRELETYNRKYTQYICGNICGNIGFYDPLVGTNKIFYLDDTSLYRIIDNCIFEDDLKFIHFSNSTDVLFQSIHTNEKYYMYRNHLEKLLSRNSYFRLNPINNDLTFSGKYKFKKLYNKIYLTLGDL